MNIISHLQDSNTGIIGVAGSDLVTRVPASWATLISPSKNLILSDPTGKTKTRYLFELEN